MSNSSEPNLDIYYLHLLNTYSEFGPQRLARLASHFPDYETAFYASSRQLEEAEIEAGKITEWLAYKKTLSLEQEVKKLHQLGIGLLSYNDEAYPRLLRDISTPPRLLYYRGKLGNGEELCVGVVGTRKISTYGQSITPGLVAPLAQNHITVVSGLAYGIDALAHQTTLDNGGRTIAVLAGGLNDEIIYPRDHVALANDIIEKGGLLLSEHPPGRGSLRQNFVIRNRIISGMSRGVLIVECDLKSGALITAEAAIAQHRLVYAVPGPIYAPNCQGTNNLLRFEKAKAVTEGEDIVRDLNIDISLQAAPKNFVVLTPQEQVVLELLGPEPVLADDVIAALDLDPSVITAALTFLEIKGHAQNLGAQQYIRIK
jgi:DNA processing protein